MAPGREVGVDGRGSGSVLWFAALCGIRFLFVRVSKSAFACYMRVAVEYSSVEKERGVSGLVELGAIALLADHR